MKTFFNLKIGLLEESFFKQLTPQQIKFDPEEIVQFQYDLEAINRLYIRKIILDEERQKFYNKLYRKIRNYLFEINKLK